MPADCSCTHFTPAGRSGRSSGEPTQTTASASSSGTRVPPPASIALERCSGASGPRWIAGAIRCPGVRLARLPRARRAATLADMPSVPQFAARGIAKSFGGRSILRGADLDVEAGSRIGVLGPNGGGKSTLLRIVAGLDYADDGNVTCRRGLVHAYLPQI